MKFFALVSGGKDSFYSIMECLRNGHELAGCAHLSPRKQTQSEDEDEEESYMYQTAASECIPTLVQECLGVPLIIRECVGRSKNTSLVYDHVEKSGKVEDEVEDLFELLSEIKRTFPSVQGISSGAILSTYQRTRIESVCGRLGFTPLGYMWRMGPQRDLLECMLKDGIEAVLVKVASPPGLIPQKHLNKSLGQLHYGGVFDRLKDKFDFHICGEGGEYETLVLDCPIFKKKLVLTDAEIVEGYDGVGILKVNKCCAVSKDPSHTTTWENIGRPLFERIRAVTDGRLSPTHLPSEDSSLESSFAECHSPKNVHLPSIKILPGGLAHISEIVCHKMPHLSDLADPSSCTDSEAQLAVIEARSIFFTLEEILRRCRWTGEIETRGNCATPKDVVFVHLYLSSISHFSQINSFYKETFGTVLPPSRSCVAVGKNVLPNGRRVMMDCLVQRGSGEYMRIAPDVNLETLTTLSVGNQKFIKEHKANPHHKLRSTLHVQSVSHWAPICVGPYSQANTVRSGVIFMAGQIGLNPGTMTLVEGGWKNELRQSWKNAASVLDALEGALSDTIGGVVYVGHNEAFHGRAVNSKLLHIWEECNNICRDSLKSNGGVNAGLVDGLKTSESEELYGGYEDYETYKEVMGSEDVDFEEEVEESSDHLLIPLLFVSLPEMPVGAVSEVELTCATNKASSCLDIKTTSSWDMKTQSYCKDSDRTCMTKYEGDINWDTGYDGMNHEISTDGQSDCPSTPTHAEIKIDSIVRCIGKGCAGVAFVAASKVDVESEEIAVLNFEQIIWDMVDSVISTLNSATGLGKSNVLHIRLFYDSMAIDDCLEIRKALHSVVGAEWGRRSKWGDRNRENILPATSVVPVKSMYLSPSSEILNPFLSMQLLVFDLVHMETEMWIHNR